MEEKDRANILHNILTRFDNAIKAENDLIGTRITWLVLSTAFTLSAFAMTTTRFQNPENSPFVLSILHVLGWFMPVFGISLALFVIPSIKAAHEALKREKDQRDIFADMLEEIIEKEFNKQLPYKSLKIKLITSQDKIHYLGNIPSLWIPWLIVTIWTILLCYIAYWFAENIQIISPNESWSMIGFTIIYVLIVWYSYNHYRKFKRNIVRSGEGKDNVLIP